MTDASLHAIEQHAHCISRVYARDCHGFRRWVLGQRSILVEGYLNGPSAYRKAIVIA